MNAAELLSQPLTLKNGAVIPNRFAKSAMSETMDNWMTKALPRLYGTWAYGQRQGAKEARPGCALVDGSVGGYGKSWCADTVAGRGVILKPANKNPGGGRGFC